FILLSSFLIILLFFYFLFFFNDTSTTEIYTLFPTRRSSDLKLDEHEKSNTCYVHINLGEEAALATDVKSYFLRRVPLVLREEYGDRKSTRLNSSHVEISYAVFCLKKKKKKK